MHNYPVVDADGHVLELDQELLDYLPPPYRGQWRSLLRACGAALPCWGIWGIR